MRVNKQGNPETNFIALVNQVQGNPYVPEEDVLMHANAIQKGDYTLSDLWDNAKAWYADPYMGNNDSL